MRTIFVTMAVLAAWSNGTAIGQKNIDPRSIRPEMAFIANEHVKLGVDLARGGSITYLGPADKQLNLINSRDFGRQIQLSFYSGPVPFHARGAKPSEHWKHLGWNPIQTGDAFGNASKVLKFEKTDREVTVLCQPSQWPLPNVPGDCTFETNISLARSAVRFRGKLKNARTDATQYPGRHQELPAVYVNAPFGKLVTYRGDKPFTNDAVSEVIKAKSNPGPWSYWLATECWAALVDDKGWGLGVFQPGAYQFIGGFAGRRGRGGPFDDPTGYVAPLRTEILDANIVYDFETWLFLGSIDDIRAFARSRSKPPETLEWRFEKDRRSWHYADAKDSGWPVRGELKIQSAGPNPHLLSPFFFQQASAAPKLILDADFPKNADGRVYWSTLEAEGFHASRSLPFHSTPGGATIEMAKSPAYRGVITSLRIDLPGPDPSGEAFTLRSVRLSR